MVSIYDKMDKNDMKYKQVFEQEETLNQEIIDCMKDFKPNTSIFNALIFTNKNNNINIKSEIKLPQNNNIQSKPQPIHQPQPQPQPRYNTIVATQPIQNTKWKCYKCGVLRGPEAKCMACFHYWYKLVSNQQQRLTKSIYLKQR
eukprot:917769_1